MDDVPYVRPREKMQQSGVEALSLSELCQIIIGRGSRHYSVARVAEHIVRLLHSTPQATLFHELQSIKGLGMVQAGKIIAAIEFGKRLTHDSLNDYDSPLDVNVLKSRRLPHLLYAYIDEQDQAMVASLERIHKNASVGKIAEHIAQYVTTHEARSLAVAVGSEHHSGAIGKFERSLIYELHHLTALHNFTLHSFTIVNRTSVNRVDSG